MVDIPEWQLSPTVHQATGMVSAQLGCAITEARARLTIRADAVGVTLEQMALDVLDGSVRFDEGERS